MAYARTFDAEAAARLEAGAAARLAAHPALIAEVVAAAGRHRALVREIREQGFAVAHGLLPRDAVLRLGERLDALIAAGKRLVRVRDHAREIAERRATGDFAFVDPAAVRAEPGALGRHTSGVNVDAPLVNLPGAAELALAPALLEVAAAYYGCVPLLTFVKARKTFVNDIPPADVQLFHADGGAFRLLKALVYLNDVGPGGGPFCYVAGSHRRRFPGWLERDRFGEDELVAVYGPESIRPIHARAGDVVFAETTGFHRGDKPRAADRRILICNYGVHPEYGFAYDPPRVGRSSLKEHGAFARAVADLVAE